MDDARDARTASLKKETATRAGRSGKETTQKEATPTRLRAKLISGISELRARATATREAARNKDASRGDVHTMRRRDSMRKEMGRGGVIGHTEL